MKVNLTICQSCPLLFSKDLGMACHDKFGKTHDWVVLKKDENIPHWCCLRLEQIVSGSLSCPVQE